MAISFSIIVFKLFSFIFQKDYVLFLLVNSSFATSFYFIFICYHEINSSSLITCNWFLYCFKSRLEILSNSFVKNTLFYLS